MSIHFSSPRSGSLNAYKFVISYLCLAAVAGFFAGMAMGQEPSPRNVIRAVRIVRDIDYRDLLPGEDAKKGKNKLDIYLPGERREFPIILFVHGGAWVHGD